MLSFFRNLGIFLTGCIAGKLFQDYRETFADDDSTTLEESDLCD